MQILTDLTQWRALRAAWRAAEQSVAFVPTMGNLHAGHCALVERARAHAAKVAVSIFVNPLQFGPGEDYARYPRTLDVDQTLLVRAGADALFVPAVETLYPRGAQILTQIQPPAWLTETLCGLSRPGHFAGVATVVAKLFNLVQPDVAVFGEKDWQQLQVVRRLVADLDFPLAIVAVPIVREADGLAMSSRNGYLTPAERAIAPRLYQILQQLAQRWRQSEHDPAQLEAEGMALLSAAGFVPEYVSVREPQCLRPSAPGDEDHILLAAARLGTTRLIDNLRLGAVLEP